MDEIQIIFIYIVNPYIKAFYWLLYRVYFIILFIINSHHFNQLDGFILALHPDFS